MNVMAVFRKVVENNLKGAKELGLEQIYIEEFEYLKKQAEGEDKEAASRVHAMLVAAAILLAANTDLGPIFQKYLDSSFRDVSHVVKESEPLEGMAPVNAQPF